MILGYAHVTKYSGGVNTGIGEFSEVVLSDEQVEQFQKYLVYNHAAGIGDPAPIEAVRRRYWINDRARRAESSPEFSRLIREAEPDISSRTPS